MLDSYDYSGLYTKKMLQKNLEEGNNQIYCKMNKVKKSFAVASIVGSLLLFQIFSSLEITLLGVHVNGWLLLFISS